MTENNDKPAFHVGAKVTGGGPIRMTGFEPTVIGCAGSHGQIALVWKGRSEKGLSPFVAAEVRVLIDSDDRGPIFEIYAEMTVPSEDGRIVDRKAVRCREENTMAILANSYRQWCQSWSNPVMARRFTMMLKKSRGKRDPAMDAIAARVAEIAWR